MNRKEGESMNSQGITPNNSEDNRELELSCQSLRSIGKESERSYARSVGKESERSYARSRKRDKGWEDSDSSPGDHDHDHDLDRESRLDRARTRTKEPADVDRDRDPDRDHVSDREGSSGSFYSEDCDKLTPSERSISPGSASASPRRPAPARKVSSSPLHRAGYRRGASHPPHVKGHRKGGSRLLRPGMQHAPHRWGCASLGAQGGGAGGQRTSSLTKEPPARDLDLVTKRLLSARLLKINELKNAFAELQLQTDQLRTENRLLRQLQLRHEKALNRYSDTESEIAQLLARHNNETAALRERLRRSQERLRTAERGQREADERLQRSERELHKLRRLADDQRLGEREELTRRLEASQQRAQESERKVKELERNMELSSGSFQRQLAGERRRTHEAQEELRSLQEEVDRLTLKLKEKERELDTRNIYANRMRHTPASRKDTDSAAKKKVPSRSNMPSRSNSKAVQTDDRALSLDFPSPPPAITDGNELPEHRTDDYLSLKELHNGELTPKEANAARDRDQERERERDRERERERGRERERLKKEREDKEREEKQRFNQELSTLEEKAKRLRDDKLAAHAPVLPDIPSVEGAGPAVHELKHWEKEDDTRKKHGLSISQKEEENRKKRDLIQEEEVKAKDAESPTATVAKQETAEDERLRKQRLLAKMREIDQQNQGGDPDRFFSESAGEPASETRPSSRVSEPRNQNQSIFSFTEPAESVSLWGGSEPAAGRASGGVAGSGEGVTGARRATLRGAQKSSEDDGFSFGSYAPSFGRPTQRAGLSSTSTSTSTSTSRSRPEVSPKPVLDAGLDAGLDLGMKDRKSNLLQQLFGSATDPATPPSKMEVLSPPPTSKPQPSGAGGRRRDTETPPSNKHNGSRMLPSNRSTLHVAESRPAVRAIASFDDDIEELTL
ncbi:lebercilin isoform X4 [Alosa sapidissima]|uniref:lebercilin isoform X4 n=1 Tax=Alosa sapidissima TaxID=34773 RepID=UPI001C0865B0|nr:lebercilin isoform X4 [Alosa sapidissima]